MTENPSTIGKLNVKVDFSDVEAATAAIKVLGDLAAGLQDQIGAAIDIKRLRFQPGDTIVVRVDRPVTRDTMEGLKAHVHKSLGIDVNVLVLDAGITLDVLTSKAA